MAYWWYKDLAVEEVSRNAVIKLKANYNNLMPAKKIKSIRLGIYICVDVIFK